MKPPESPLPLVRCADEYFRIFGNPWEGTKVLRGLGLGILIMLVGNVIIALMKSVGLMWLVALLTMVGGSVAVWIHYCRPRGAAPAQDGKPAKPGISRAQFFPSLPCPHCGKPVGSTYSKQMILHLRCNSCGGEAKTDCLFMNSGGAPTKV